MQWYPWLDVIYYKMLSSYRQGKGPHAALLCSTRWNYGEENLINAVIRWLMCSNTQETQFCGVCDSCRLMKIGNHPDYYLIDCTKDVQWVGIDVIRACIKKLYTYSYQHKIKIVFVRYIEYLTEQAINALLKIIEEPPSNTYFFLKTRKYMQIPSTLLSRCIKWFIVAPKESVGLKWLIKQKKIDNILHARCALRLCNKSPIEAEIMFIKDHWNNRLKLCKSIRCSISDKNFLKIMPFLYSVNSIQCDFSLYWLITLLLDALKWQNEIKKIFLMNLDQIELIDLIANYWNAYSLTQQLQQWLLLFYLFQKCMNINRKLLLTDRLLNWQRNIVEDYLYSWSI